MGKRVDELPVSTDENFWMDAELTRYKSVPIRICPTHRKDNWTEHDGYTADKYGVILCRYCPWGTMNQGFYRVVNGKIVDLRSLAKA